MARYVLKDMFTNDVKILNEKDFEEEMGRLMEIAIDETDFDNVIDECYPEIRFGDFSFDASSVLRKVDPSAYNIFLKEYRDKERDSKLQELNERGECEFGYIIVTKKEEGEEDAN